MGGVLQTVVDFMDNAVRSGGRVLVHCAGGISRSTTAVLAYLVAKRNYSLRDAFAHAHKVRPVVWPNRGFMRILIHWEKTQRSKNVTMRLSQYELWSEYDPY